MGPDETYHIDILEKMLKELKRQINVGEKQGHTITRQKYDRMHALEWALNRLNKE